MARRSLVVALAAAALCATAAIATQIKDLNANYYPGHSGQIVLVGQEQTVRDAHAVVVDSQHFFSGVSSVSSLALTSLPRVLAAALGIQSPIGAHHNDDDVQQLVKPNSEVARQRPNAQIIFNVESVGKTTLDRFHLNSLSNPAASHLSLSLSTPSVTPPASSLSVSTSASTGAPVSAHGIVADRWKDEQGKVVSAFDVKHAAQSFAQVQNLADLVSAATAGKGMTLSVSGSPKLAWSFAANPSKSPASARNYALSLADGATVFKALGDNSIPALSFQIGELTHALETSSNSLLNNLGDHMHAKLVNHVVTLTYSPSKKSAAVQTARFDLKQKADALFIAELQYVLDLPSKLKSVAAVTDALNDASQDLIVVSFSAFTALLEQYGRESEQLRGALRMFDQLFPLMSSEFASLFGSEQSPAMQTLLFLGSHHTVLEKADPRAVQSVLARDHVQALDFFPNIYTASPQETAKLCAKLNKDLSAVHYTAYCPGHAASAPSAAAPKHVLVEMQAAGQAEQQQVPAGRRLAGVSPSSQRACSAWDVPCADNLQRYQIVLWASVALAFIAIAAVYQLAFMSFKKDTLLYSSFNPNWEDRKRR